MDTLAQLQANLLSPVVLAFVLGLVATWVRSDLKLPDDLYSSMSLYLLLAIGLKGGVALAQTPLRELLLPATAAVAFAAAIPLWCTPLLRHLGGFSPVDSAAIAAHYGSVSIVTFLAATAFLDTAAIPYEGYVPTLAALLEVPAIVVALLLGKRASRSGEGWGPVLHEVLAGRSVVLLLGGLAIGAICGQQGVQPVAPLFTDLFRGVLMLFLLEMGMATARRFADLRRVGWFLIAFGITVPVVHGTAGVLIGHATGLSQGGATVLAALLASASYIAAPAAVRIALPEANPTFYLSAALAVTFPFNLAIGIPLYARLAAAVYG